MQSIQMMLVLLVVTLAPIIGFVGLLLLSLFAG
jgi:hypothetical protein